MDWVLLIAGNLLFLIYMMQRRKNLALVAGGLGLIFYALFWPISEMTLVADESTPADVIPPIDIPPVEATESTQKLNLTGINISKDPFSDEDLLKV